MIKTTRFCDKCEREVPGKEQLWDITIQRRLLGSHVGTNTPLLHGKHLCRPCMVELRMLPAAGADPSPPSEPTTFEQLLRAVVREEINSD